MSRPEVLGRVERRRRFSIEEKHAILAEASDPAVNVSAVARRHGLFPAQLYKWRRLAELGVIGIPGASELPSFVAVQIAREPNIDSSRCSETAGARAYRPVTPRAGAIEIDLGDGRRVVVDEQVNAAALTRVLVVLGRQ
jgi:transposase